MFVLLSARIPKHIHRHHAPESNALPSKGTAKFLTNVKVRSGPGTSYSAVATYQKGETVTYDKTVTGDSRTWISYIGGSGNRRYCCAIDKDGTYFVSVSGSSSGGSSSGGSSGSGKTITGVYTTGYYPDNSAMEGGYYDCLGNKLRTLHAYKPGSYVSLAVDKTLIPLRSTVYIDGYNYNGSPIKFWACDVGGAIKGKHVDICCANAAETYKVTKKNQVLHVY